MCKFSIKSQLFRYLVQQISCKYSYDNTADVIDFCNTEKIDVPQKYSNTFLMKCLYFACLESCVGKENDLGLFKIFDNMKAYPRGPLEYDIYENFANIEGLVYEDGRISKVEKKSSKDFEEGNQIYVKQIDSAVENLRAHGTLKMSVRELIDMSHKLYLWSESYNFSNNRDIIITPEAIQKEVGQYLHYLS